MSGWRADLARALEETLEQLAFMLVEEQEESCQAAAGSLCWARLELLSPLPGLLGVEMSPDLAARLLQMVTGDESGREALLLDTVAELANTVAGRFLNRRLGGGTEFQLGLPLAGRGELPDSGLVWQRQSYQVDGGCLRISVTGRDFS
ncbi:MAG: chemotaxis protein CheX [Candidatus Delongbacteria bacterium]